MDTNSSCDYTCIAEICLNRVYNEYKNGGPCITTEAPCFNPNCKADDYICIVNNCSGAIGNGTTLFNYWYNNNCPAAYAQLINTTLDGVLAYNPEAQLLSQCYVNDLFNTYATTNTITDNVLSPSYDPFQNRLLDLCLDPTLPGICGQYLNNFCPTDRNTVIESPILTNFCGCYTPPDPTYLQYTLASTACTTGSTGCTAGCTAGTSGCTGQPACDPLCHRALTSQKAYQPTGNLITCPQKICVIDDVTITANQSTVAGGINFNMVCPGCAGPGEGCLCVVSGTNISSTMSQIGVGPNFNFFCGQNSVCIVEDSQGNPILEEACPPIDLSTLPTKSYPVYPNILIVVIITIAVILVLLLCIASRTAPVVIHQKQF
jgi:hypothetical protein